MRSGLSHKYRDQGFMFKVVSEGGGGGREPVTPPLGNVPVRHPVTSVRDDTTPTYTTADR